jgi:hypothetical protein
MESKTRNLGRAYLVGKLQARGLSRRRSVLIVNVILSRMIHGLKRGWEVEFPFGKLKRVKRHFGKVWDAIDDWPANRDPCTIVHELDEAGDRELHPWAWPTIITAETRSRRSINSGFRARGSSVSIDGKQEKDWKYRSGSCLVAVWCSFSISFSELALHRAARTWSFNSGHCKRSIVRTRESKGWFLNKITTIYKKPYTVALEVDAESSSLRSAQRYLNDQLLQRDEGGALGGPDVSLNVYLDRWLALADRPRLRDKSYIDDQVLVARRVRPTLGEGMMRTLTPLDLQVSTAAWS